MIGPEQLPVIQIHIGAHGTTVAIDGERLAPTLAIGSYRTAEEFLAHYPPLPAELERAIAAIEDALESGRPLPRHRCVVLNDEPVLTQLARQLGADDGRLAREAVEQLYQKLARAVMAGTATPSPGPARDREETAALVILREMMHHLSFREAWM